MTTRALSRSEEDYLKAIYGLSESGNPASTTAIAAVLEIQPASVTGMIKRMAESGLLEHIPYRGVRLTDHGAREALRVLRRHRILETYLCERLGFSWDDVHAEAERMHVDGTPDPADLRQGLPVGRSQTRPGDRRRHARQSPPLRQAQWLRNSPERFPAAWSDSLGAESSTG